MIQATVVEEDNTEGFVLYCEMEGELAGRTFIFVPNKGKGADEEQEGTLFDVLKEDVLKDVNGLHLAENARIRSPITGMIPNKSDLESAERIRVPLVTMYSLSAIGRQAVHAY